MDTKKSMNHKKMHILGAGCGEGSHIYSIFEMLKENQGNPYVGLDISVEVF